ncbi:D-arabinono-1,4-lactone oxidase [Planosporangium mesophilum]|uniref:D-arabinono-1,4-lactone oxidase n=1 Tax=Planosporangium mesophilum TaxID=689768 RepID=UPI0014398746|nr:D-arabinono-1,4-lactone oxidase [Planosporangium mesophilum]NJC82019.1 FAD-binding protein [Planosporangium mesophilum]
MTYISWSNWSGTASSTASRVVFPTERDGVVAAVSAAAADGLRIKAVGSGHSFTAAAATTGVRVELGALSSLLSVDAAARLVTVQAGMPLHRLNVALATHGLALPNLGDIDTQTISGALATGTHGTGGRFGCLSTFVEAIEIVTGTGEVLRCSRSSSPEVFAAAAVNLGALGIVTELTLRCVDAFTLRASEQPAPLPSVLADLDSLVGLNDHVEFYWFPYTDRVQLKRNNRVAADDEPLARWRGWLDDEFLSNRVFAAACRLGRAAPRTVPTISRVSSWALAPRTYTGPSHEVFCTPRRVRFVEMEYGLPRDALRPALAELRRIVDSLPSAVVFPVEVRFTGADDLWLSHGYGRDSAYIAIHQYVGMPYEEYFKRFEAVATSLGGRPHWGKLHYRDAAYLTSAYPRFADFRAVRDKLDPDRLFANEYLDRVLG